ncbi:hypothetical protein NDU88_009565 [Pleurodeles waltl]|uniref:Uncharacterized protein n=1 Tax=Pleurodeles waltl TaxID=8319 RepID=A0AAV7P2L0_PLEWA|nr:hypothetical protein NDU88_009565 [Pleurodeles waltl]
MFQTGGIFCFRRLPWSPCQCEGAESAARCEGPSCQPEGQHGTGWGRAQGRGRLTPAPATPHKGGPLSGDRARGPEPPEARGRLPAASPPVGPPSAPRGPGQEPARAPQTHHFKRPEPTSAPTPAAAILGRSRRPDIRSPRLASPHTTFFFAAHPHWANFSPYTQECCLLTLPVRPCPPYVRGGSFIQLLPAGVSSCVRLRSPSAVLRMRERSQQHRSKRGV